MKKKISIGVITGAVEGNSLVYSFMKILEPSVESILLITANYPGKDIFSTKIKLVNYSINSKQTPMLIKIIKFIYLQFSINYHLIKNIRRTSIIIFFLDDSIFLFPMILARLSRKRVLKIITHSTSLIAKQQKKNFVYRKCLNYLERLSYTLSHNLVVYSPSMITSLKLEGYKQKIIVAKRHFIDFDKFEYRIPLKNRKTTIGFIGRLSEEKGIINFIQSIPLLLEKNKGLRFFIGGPGMLKNDMFQYIKEKNISDKIDYIEWIPHDEIPGYLNTLKLLVIPSYTEGMSNVMLEAMACGTPVLITPVGSVPDVIINNENGFIMNDNSPECIANNVMRVLNHPNLEEIAEKEHSLIKKEFTFQRAVKRYNDLLTSQL